MELTQFDIAATEQAVETFKQQAREEFKKWILEFYPEDYARELCKEVATSLKLRSASKARQAKN